MKKTIPIVLLLIIFIGGCFYSYQYFYGGASYYTKITTNGEKTSETADNGETYTVYNYEDQPAYNEEGEKTTVELHESRDQPLRLNAYLKLKVNPRKGVLSWEEVSQKEVPKKALDKLE
ncbi:YxeA family protein [Enterococcus mediterraneensis]|uniref:YxeA family protein n=1 Tax=Enterococcus mediterraneensis TaxID=2364791 RepID=UPI000F052F9A|nr:YxeA family protein [Enterococcus mediterraneensis]